MDKLQEKYIKMYLSGESLREYDILEKNELFFKTVLIKYGSWNNFEKSVGILQRHIRERERFELYWIFKRRLKEFGEESLRHKNIEDMFKEKMVDHFRTVSYVTNTLIKQGKNEALYYEVHARILCGITFEEILKLEEFKKFGIDKIDKDSFFEEYQRKFLLDLNKIYTIDNKEELDFELLETVFTDVKTLIEIGFLDEDKLLEIQKELSEQKYDITSPKEDIGS